MNTKFASVMTGLTMALTFGLYGLVRKMVHVGPLAGMTVETLLLYPPALGIVPRADRLLAPAPVAAGAAGRPGCHPDRRPAVPRPAQRAVPRLRAVHEPVIRAFRLRWRWLSHRLVGRFGG